jgi:predicted DNA binding CopG/RHH family protein
MEEPMSTKPRLPKTDSIEELASFWDTHDLTEFEDELEEVPGQVFRRDRSITLHFDEDQASAIRELASAKGLAEAELIRSWVMEKLHSA